ncbi:MAG: hypothetical protein P8J02_09130 [Yoonia sp.]|nr:hypothetical protein [Yoonia sp.]
MIKTFRNDEAGAVTVDWVVLTAAIVLLGAAVGGSIKTGATNLATDVGADMTAMVTEENFEFSKIGRRSLCAAAFFISGLLQKTFVKAHTRHEPAAMVRNNK